jgi:hypothetical protein
MVDILPSSPPARKTHVVREVRLVAYREDESVAPLAAPDSDFPVASAFRE